MSYIKVGTEAMPRDKKIAIFTSLLILSALTFASAADPVVKTGNMLITTEGIDYLEIQGSKNLSGSIGIVTRDDDEIKVNYKMNAVAGSESQASRFLDLISLQLDNRQDNKAVLRIITPLDAPWQGKNYQVSLDILIEIPEKMGIKGEIWFMRLDASGPLTGVELRAAYSSINLSDIQGPIDVTTSFAALQMTDINGNIKAENRYGSIKVSDITVADGNAIFQNTSGAIELSNIKGPVEAYTSYSPIEATDITADEGTIVLRTSYSPISVENVLGELICETTFSPIEISNCSLTHGQSKIETSYSPITADFNKITDSQLFIYNNYNNINIMLPRTLSAQILAIVDNGGRIHTSELPLKPTQLNTNHLEGYVGDGDDRIELKVSGIGTIEIKGR
jgi:hypothetical protein